MKEILTKLDEVIASSPGDCFFNDPANDEMIISLENKHKIRLPVSFATFLKQYNGGFISLISNHKEINIDDLAWNSNYILAVELIDEIFEKINHKTEGMNLKYIPFLHTSSGEYLGFMYPFEGNGESKVYDLWHEAPVEEWAESVVYGSFADLLKDYIENQGNIETM